MECYSGQAVANFIHRSPRARDVVLLRLTDRVVEKFSRLRRQHVDRIAAVQLQVPGVYPWSIGQTAGKQIWTVFENAVERVPSAAFDFTANSYSSSG